MLNRLALALLAVFVVGGSAAAHYTYIVPGNFRVAAGDTVVIGFHSGDGFPDSTAMLKRLQNPTVHQSGHELKVEGLQQDGKRVFAGVTIGAQGHVIVTGVNGTAVEEMDPKPFEDYLREEGLTDIIQSRAERGESNKPAKERYTMYAKAIFVAGAPNDGYKAVVGLPLEIVPEKDPYRLQAGEALPVRVLLRGAAVANIELRASSTAPGSPTVVGKTDADGRITVPVGAGKWRLHAIHMERANGDVDWESLWTTLTFEVS